MATQITRFYVKQGDWILIFNNLKLQAFSLGLQDLCQYLQNAKVDQHGRIEGYDYTKNIINHMLEGNKKAALDLEQQAKQIVKQARQLGLKAAYNDLSRLHLRDLV